MQPIYFIIKRTTLPFEAKPKNLFAMQNIKHTQRSCVEFGFDGTIHKRFSGPMARERFSNEARVLHYLQDKGCDFVPRVVELNEDTLELVMTNCGDAAPLISEQKTEIIFHDLEEKFGVRHGDPFARNITYNHRKGGFNVIDFEYAQILETGEGFSIQDEEAKRHIATSA